MLRVETWNPDKGLSCGFSLEGDLAHEALELGEHGVAIGGVAELLHGREKRLDLRV